MIRSKQEAFSRPIYFTLAEICINSTMPSKCAKKCHHMIRQSYRRTAEHAACSGVSPPSPGIFTGTPAASRCRTVLMDPFLAACTRAPVSSPMDAHTQHSFATDNFPLLQHSKARRFPKEKVTHSEIGLYHDHHGYPGCTEYGTVTHVATSMARQATAAVTQRRTRAKLSPY